MRGLSIGRPGQGGRGAASLGAREEPPSVREKTDLQGLDEHRRDRKRGKSLACKVLFKAKKTSQERR